MIKNPTKLLKLSNDPEVYISRRSLKHFVERRKEEMFHKYSRETIIHRMNFVVENIQQIVNKTNLFDIANNKQIYLKYFEHDFKSYIRVIAEVVNNHLEIKTMHFKRNKKAT